MKRRVVITVFLAVVALWFAFGGHEGEVEAFGVPTGTSGTVSDNVYFSLTGKRMIAEDADHFIVEFSCSLESLQTSVASAGGVLDGAYPQIGVAVVKNLDDRSAKSLKKSPGISSVTRDLMVQWVPEISEETEGSSDIAPQPLGYPTDAVWFYVYQWNMRQIQMPAAWQIELGSPEVRVAVLDSGISPDHQDMIGRYHSTLNVSFVSNPIDGVNDPTDYRYHGTAVAGIISTRNLVVAGVAPNITLIGVKVLAYTGSGSFSTVIKGIMYAVDVAEADVINMSLGAVFPKNSRGGGILNAALTKAVNYANSRGALVVVAAGNDALDLDHSGNLISVPAESGTAFAVSATGPSFQANFDNLAYYSNYGVSAVDVAAPGGGYGVTADLICSPLAPNTVFFPIGGATNYYIFGNGTSFSAPHVSGIAALLKSHNPALTPAQLRAIIEQTADDLGKPGVDLFYSHGRVNAYHALAK